MILVGYNQGPKANAFCVFVVESSVALYRPHLCGSHLTHAWLCWFRAIFFLQLTVATNTQFHLLRKVSSPCWIWTCQLQRTGPFTNNIQNSQVSSSINLMNDWLTIGSRLTRRRVWPSAMKRHFTIVGSFTHEKVATDKESQSGIGRRHKLSCGRM